MTEVSTDELRKVAAWLQGHFDILEADVVEAAADELDRRRQQPAIAFEWKAEPENLGVIIDAYIGDWHIGRVVEEADGGWGAVLFGPDGELNEIRSDTDHGLWNDDDDAKAALETRVRSQLSAGDGWQAMDSAPKDGTVVDLWGTRTGKGGFPVEQRRFTNAQWTEDRMPGTGDSTGRFSWKHDCKDAYGTFEYHCWRPLPLPPKEHG